MLRLIASASCAIYGRTWFNSGMQDWRIHQIVCALTGAGERLAGEHVGMNK